MSNDNPGRTARTSGNAPMGSTIAIVVTAVALILGFLILRKVNDSGSDSGTPAKTDPGTTQPTGTTTTAPQQTTTTTINITATKVQVANASNLSGVAKQLSLALQGKGYDTAEATNSTVSPKLDKTKVIYNGDDPNSLGVANAVAAQLGNVPVEKGGAALPVKSGTWATGSGVIVLLGNDLAGKTLDEIAGGATNTTGAPTTT
jgi:hypothetical protein